MYKDKQSKQEQNCILKEKHKKVNLLQWNIFDYSKNVLQMESSFMQVQTNVE